MHHERQRQHTKWLSLLMILYTWRGHAADAKIMRKIQQDESIPAHRTEKGAIINTMKLTLCTIVAYMTEGGGPDGCRKAFCGPPWMNYQSPVWDMTHADDPTIPFESPPTYWERYWRQRRTSPDYDELEERTLLVLNNRYDPDELAYLIKHLPYHLVGDLEQRYRLHMQDNKGPLGSIFRNLLPGSSARLGQRTLYRLREGATSLAICHLRLGMIEKALRVYLIHNDPQIFQARGLTVDAQQRMQTMDRDQRLIYNWCCKDLQLNFRIKGWRSIVEMNWSYMLNNHISNRDRWMWHPSLKSLTGSDKPYFQDWTADLNPNGKING